MKALSIHPLYARAIALGDKWVEVRTWKTDYRGDIVICSTKKKYHGTIPGHALCVVNLIDVVPLQKKHMEGAMLKKSDWEPGLYAWILDDNRLIVPQPVKGKLSLWEYNGIIDFIPVEEWQADLNGNNCDWIEKYWRNLMT